MHEIPLDVELCAESNLPQSVSVGSFPDSDGAVVRLEVSMIHSPIGLSETEDDGFLFDVWTSIVGLSSGSVLRVYSWASLKPPCDAIVVGTACHA